jgi:AcrR family transcriptional regulator
MLLRQALVELIEDRGFDRVTVGDLTARAMISRAAFYRNYRDKYELVEQIFDEAMAGMTADDDGDTRSPGRRLGRFPRAHRRLPPALRRASRAQGQRVVRQPDAFGTRRDVERASARPRC